MNYEEVSELLKKPEPCLVVLISISTVVLYFADFSKVFFMIYFSAIISDVLLGTVIKGGGGYAKFSTSEEFKSKGHVLLMYFFMTAVVALLVETQGDQLFSWFEQTKSPYTAFSVAFVMNLSLYLKIHQLFFAKKK